MTSLDMAGMSLTLLRVTDDAVLQALDAPAAAPGWPATSGRLSQAPPVPIHRPGEP